jgi:oligopeptidase B
MDVRLYFLIYSAFEYEEWGNPEFQAIYETMKSYCPYSNIAPGVVYPNMLIVAGMNDPRVAYFEPAKWTAKLRALVKWSKSAPIVQEQGESLGDSFKQGLEENDPLNDGDRLLLLKIQDAGHSGSTGQYALLEDLAFEYAYLISVLGAQFKPVSSGGKGLTGVDYEMYWEELEHEAGDEDEEGDEEGKEESQN